LRNEEENDQTHTIQVNEFNKISIADLEKALKTSKNRKAPRIDGINMELLKYGSSTLKNRLIQLLYDIWNVGRIPKEWKQPVINNIYKKGDKSQCTNYTGISLLNSVYKICISILKAKLQPMQENVLTDEQCGFRKGRSCMDAVFTIKQIIEKRI
jgi:hypothetical protein